ncbi:MAG: ABC transporter permease [Candidatus Bathyarchaeia archaeon]|jgi:peptide/nickel transport system permease protein
MKRSNWSPAISELKFAGHLIVRNKLVLVGTVIAVAVLMTATFSTLLVSPAVIVTIDLPNRLQPPSITHWLGTDDYGRDLFAMIILSTRLDVIAMLEIVGAGVTIGVTLGAFSGFLGGKLDEALMRVTDIFFSIPGLILALAVAAALGPGLNNLILAIIVVQWPGYTRILRGQVLAEKQRLYVDALRALGIGKVRVILRHIIPNTIYPVIVQCTLDLGGVILTFASLSFLGFGGSPLTPDLGRLITAGQLYIFQAPWLTAFPGLAILIISLAFNLMGDGIRDVLDPRLRR